jgi:orotidine-5'-phosphate decarboxylase
MDPVERVIPALDTDLLEEACRWVDRFQGRLSIFKVGSQLFTRAGPRAVEAIREKGGRVFLDLKYHDIPNTVSGAVRAATALGVTFLNVHALGGAEMIRAAVEASREEAGKRRLTVPKVLAVTILTSLDAAQLHLMGLRDGVEGCVMRLAHLAVEAGADGLVASPREVRALREAFGQQTLLVTPGIRAKRDSRDDQKRVMEPRQALEAGADYLVMGRSLVEAPDPVAVLEDLLE